MSEILVLGREDVERLLEVDPLLDALEDAFRALSAGRTSVPARVAARTPDGLLGAMPGWVRGMGLASKLVTVFPANAAEGLPSHQGLIVLFDDRTGTPVAILDGQRITALRTAAASAVAARLLARPGARVLAVLGAGVQGRAHLETVPRVLELEEVRIASRTPEHADALAGEAPGILAASAVGDPPRVTTSPSFREAVRGADVVCCCTDAHRPIVEDGWLAPGAHVSSVGGSAGRELDADTIYRGSVFVEWRGAVTEPLPAGAGELQGLDPDVVAELGEVLDGRRPGRRTDDELTVYKSTGHAVEDVAAARLVVDGAREVGAGTTLAM